MAVENSIGADDTLPASGDLSANQFYFVKIDSNGRLALCTTAAGEGFAGVLQNKPSALGRDGAYRYLGISKVACGGSFNPGDYVTSDSAGKAVKYTTSKVFTGTPYIVSGSQVYGLARDAGVSGQIASIMILHQGLTN